MKTNERSLIECKRLAQSQLPHLIEQTKLLEFLTLLIHEVDATAFARGFAAGKESTRETTDYLPVEVEAANNA